MTQMPNLSHATTNREMWRLADVRKCIPLSKPTIYRLVASGSFPRPIGLSPGTSAWIAQEVRDWLDEKIRSERKVIGHGRQPCPEDLASKAK